jgi:predicted nuclease of predicted toxin-antitoxin system
MTNSIRFYLDENIAKEFAKGLKTRDIDVVTTPELGHMVFTDEQHLAHALLEDRVFVTEDEDFLRHHSEGIPHAGIVYYKQKTRSIKEIIRGLALIYDVYSPEDMINHVEYL